MMGLNDAGETYIKGRHYNYNFTWKESLCFLYEWGLTKEQHRQLAHLKAEFANTIYIVADSLDELTRSMDAKEPESERYETWTALKQAKAYRNELIDMAKLIVLELQGGAK